MLRGYPADLRATGSGPQIIGLGPCPRGLALARAPWPARRARKVENIESVLRGTPSHLGEPTRTGETRSTSESLSLKKVQSSSHTFSLCELV